MHSERINRFFRCRKTLTSHIIFGVRKQKEVIRSQVRTIRRMTHEIDVLSAQKCSCLSRCVRARIVVVKSDPSSAVGFPDFLEDNWQTNGSVPLRTGCSALFYWYDATCPVFSEKTGDHLLGSAACASNFCWIFLILKNPYSRLLFTFGLYALIHDSSLVTMS